MLDLVLAIFHHVLIFALFSVLISELVLVKTGMDTAAAARLASIDTWYGVLAGLILVVGFARVIFAAKGWPYYEHNAFFHAKIAIFVLIALLSVRPTVGFIRWKRAPAGPPPGQIAEVRRYLWIELVLFPLLLVCAAAMARGYGEF
jgi:putative membrane protein